MKLSALSPYRWVRKFHSNSKELPLSLLSSTAVYFIYRPLTSHWRGKTHRNKQAKTLKITKHKNTQSKHLTCDLLALHLPEIKCFSSVILREVDVQENCLLGPPFPSISGSTLMITALDYSTNIYWTFPYFQFSWSNAYRTVICAVPYTGYSKMY